MEYTEYADAILKWVRLKTPGPHTSGRWRGSRDRRAVLLKGCSHASPIFLQNLFGSSLRPLSRFRGRLPSAFRMLKVRKRTVEPAKSFNISPEKAI